MRFRRRPKGIEAAELRSRMMGAGSRALRRSAAPTWSLLQGTAGAVVAWVIARHLVGNHEPFFAPIAAVIALNNPVGERGSNALRLVLGVIVGILVGEATLVALGGGYGRLALATFAAMAVARALGGSRMMINQAAISAVLTVAVAGGDAGTSRLVDALIGAGVALAFSQVLFSPEPVRLVRRAEAAALVGMAEGLRLTALALERDDDELGERATGAFRDLRDRLAELGRLRRTSPGVARHSLVWRSRMAPLVHENENAGHLDLLGVSCLVLTRAAMATEPPERTTLAASVRELARILGELASEPGDRETRQGAVDRAVDVARQLARIPALAESTLAAALNAVRMVAADIMLFAGVDAGQALAAAQEGTGEFQVHTPPSTPRIPFRPNRRRPPR